MPNALLKRLADDPKVKRVHLDREATGEMARTAAAVGALTARLSYGYTGAGIGVAVIDSGITSWHDDLGASATSKTGQRVTAFVDFVNNRTAKYDDWGHGTHVAGIIAGSGYDSYGAARRHRAEGEHRRAQGARRRRQGPHQQHHRGARLGRRQPRAIQHPRRQHVARRGRLRELQHRPADAGRQARRRRGHRRRRRRRQHGQGAQRPAAVRRHLGARQRAVGADGRRVEHARARSIAATTRWRSTARAVRR